MTFCLTLVDWSVSGITKIVMKVGSDVHAGPTRK